MALDMVRDLASFIIGQGEGQAIGSDVYLDTRPPTPDHCLSVIDTGGFGPNSGVDDLKRTAQLVCRDKSAAVAKAWAWRLYRLLSPAGGRTVVQGTTTMVTNAANPPFSIGPDDNARAVYAFNLVIVTRPDE